MDLRYVFSLLSDEKVRSAVQVVTGIVRNNCNSLTNSGNNLRHSVFSINMFTTSFMQVTLGDSSIDRPARSTSQNIARCSSSRLWSKSLPKCSITAFIHGVLPFTASTIVTSYAKCWTLKAVVQTTHDSIN